jgi:hypothetical protein
VIESANMSTGSIFSHRGWNRLVIVIAATYMIVIACLVFHERRTINPFDQFDNRRPSGYVFWHWSASTYKDGHVNAHWLVPRVGVVIEAMLLPPIAFAGVVYSILWIHRGFRLSRQSSPVTRAEK